jgi:dienelactone hydrolase
MARRAPVEGEETMTDFSDLLDIRKGGEGLTMGRDPSYIAQITTVEEWELKARALREILSQTLGHAPEIACPLSPRVIDETDCGDYIRRRVEYLSEPEEKIPAYVLIPKNLKEKAPAVLCIHPTTPLGKEQAIGSEDTPKGQDRAYALHLVRRGYITLAYDLLSAGERCYEGRQAFDTAPFYEKHPEWSVRGKDLWDVRRSIDFLEGMDQVDATRIGCIGHSQGGGITIHAMAMDPRIKAGVSSCGTWPARLSKNPFNHARTGWWVGRPFLRPYCYAGQPFPIDMHECLALAAPRAIMNISALNDWQSTLEEAPLARAAFDNLAENVSQVFALFGTQDRFRNVLHLNEHGFALEQRRVAYAFLDQHLRG